MTKQEQIRILGLAWRNRNSICWEDFAQGRSDFPDSHTIAFPFEKGSRVANTWENFFKNYFGNKRTNYPFTVRLLNSFVLAAA